MKKLAKIIAIIFTAAGGIITVLANIDGTLSLAEKSTNMGAQMIQIIHIAYIIFKIIWSIFLPSLIIYLIFIVYKKNDEISVLSKGVLKNLKDMNELKMDLKFKQVINEYRATRLYKSMARVVSLTNKKDDASSYTPLLFCDTLMGKFEVASIPHEIRLEKAYFLEYLNSQDIPRTETEKEALINKYTVDKHY